MLDNIQGGNWLYFDPGKMYEINPAAGFQVNVRDACTTSPMAMRSVLSNPAGGR